MVTWYKVQNLRHKNPSKALTNLISFYMSVSMPSGFLGSPCAMYIAWYRQCTANETLLSPGAFCKPMPSFLGSPLGVSNLATILYTHHVLCAKYETVDISSMWYCWVHLWDFFTFLICSLRCATELFECAKYVESSQALWPRFGHNTLRISHCSMNLASKWNHTIIKVNSNTSDERKVRVKEMLVARYRRDCESVSPMLIMVACDATEGSMPLARWARLVYKLFQFIKVGGGGGERGRKVLACFQVSLLSIRYVRYLMVF